MHQTSERSSVTQAACTKPHSHHLSRPSSSGTLTPRTVLSAMFTGDLHIEWVTPLTPSCNTAYLLDTVNFRIAIKVNTSGGMKTEDIYVYLWTNLYHKYNSEGEWHAVQATYQGIQQKKDNDVTLLMFGVKVIPTCLGDYCFTYKARHKFAQEFKWSQDFEIDGHIKVTLPVKDQTTWIQVPMSNQITHNVYIGNFTAALQAIDDGFYCLLNMADDAHIFPKQFTYPINYKRCLLPFGVNKPISPKVIQKVVSWLRFMSDNCNKVMVCSRMGQARAGSVLIAYIYFMNPDLSFEEAYAFVDRRSFVYPHKDLKSTVMALYPRS